MEQRPPKSPVAMSHNCPHYSYPFQMMPPPPPPPLTAAAAAATWMDDFLDFSATRRSHHRRTVSDPIAFVETPTIFQESNNNNNVNYHNGHTFERLDDEQLRNMFTDDVGPYPGSNPSSANPSTSPSSDDHNGSESMMSDEKIKLMSSSQPNVKNEPGEEDSSNNQQNYNTTPLEFKDSSDQAIVDPKRIKRILANRQSAQRSRVRKLHYISELERSVTTLQTEVSALSPRVAFMDHQRLLLTVDNSALKQRIAALAQDKIFKDAHQEALRKEIERLKRIYHEQTMKKMSNDATDDEPPPFAVTAGKKRVSSEE